MNPKGLEVSPLFIAIVGVIIGVIILIYVYCITAGWCYGAQTLFQAQQRLGFGRRSHQEQDEETPSTDLENSMVHLIPVRKYTKNNGASVGVSVNDDEAMCSVCLGEFEEGEAVKILPECTHSFHVPCIDMWLYSHSSCPLCRTDAIATPPRQQLLQPQPEVQRTSELGE
ncbi:Ring-h2 finger protein atl52 [Thalictrum thalictroides]|uniref:RING-type E3 ubiquitin transferase n=1 Tax=Thalictrum thalictroides TaxID=46969 RepID=A0A7J6WR16_THATH|nr:Ring-h2 finger protein atl52 [Thalictrum thalictroides]